MNTIKFAIHYLIILTIILISPLSAQELKLFQLFESDPEKIFSLDEMSNHIWEDQVVTKYSPWAIYKLISNLNNKLPPLGLRIENYRGRGYQLIKIKK